MSDTDTRQARIEAISAVIDRWFGGVGDDYTQAANEIIDAADAAAAPDVDPDTTIIFDAPVVGVTAAAPAVGGTVDEMDRDILIERFFYAFRAHVDYEMCMEWLADDDGYGPCPRYETNAAFGRVLDALLTAQPEPGTHDDDDETETEAIARREDQRP